MRITPIRNNTITLRGVFDFTAEFENGPQITDSYSLQIYIPHSFPRAIPRVEEINRKIPRDGKHHINSDGTLCLGSPIRLLQQLSRTPNISGFVGKCLVPHLYAVSHKFKYGNFPFGELEHGAKGIIKDYMDLFGLQNRGQVIWTLALLGNKKRIANKMTCPCGCGLRVGRCSFRLKIIRFRGIASRAWYRAQIAEIKKG